MKNITTVVSSLALSIAAATAQATVYDVTLDMSGSVSGGGGGSLFGTGVGTYDDATEIMTFTFDQEVTSNGLFGIGKGVAQQVGDSVYNFATNSGTNTITGCSQISGSSCGFVPLDQPQTLQSLSDIDFNAMTFVGVSKYQVATTTQNWTITSFTPQVVPVPAAAWLFGSALLGLVGVNRRAK